MTIMATATRTAREYARSSKGKGGSSRSTRDQHTANLAAETEFGPWTWGQAYVDTGSASKYATKVRDDFDRLTADLASGEFGAPGDVLVLWEISRLSREMGVGTKIVDLCEAGGYLIHITSEERTYNPANYNDRHTLNAGINDAERESRRLSKRTLRGVTSNVNAVNDDGDPAARPHGVIPFGYTRDYGLVDGKSRPTSQYPVPAEAEIVIELYRRVLAGDSIRSVALDFQARGLTGRRGKPFSPATLRVMLTKDAYRGYRAHNGQTGKASWPVISVYKGSEVTAEEFTAIWHGVQALLADPTRRTHTGTAIKHEYSATLRCDNCGGPMNVANGNHNHPTAYACHDKGCTRINKAEVDEIVTGDVLALLSDPDVYARLAPSTDDGAAATVRTQLTAKRAQLKAFEDEDPETPAEARLIGRKIEKLGTEIAELEIRERDLTQPSRLAKIFPDDPGKDIAERWADAPVTVRREIAAMLLTPELLGEVRIKRVADSASDAVADRIVWRTED